MSIFLKLLSLKILLEFILIHKNKSLYLPINLSDQLIDWVKITDTEAYILIQS